MDTKSSICTTASPSTTKLGDSTLSSATSNPRDVESFSVFGDDSCGEPLMAQHVVLDFTPQEEIDTDYVQKKCCAFWEYISRRTDLQSMLVLPEVKSYLPPDESDSSSSPSDTSSGTAIPHERTALSMLEFVERKGLIDRTFEAKMPQSNCSLGSREYRENEPSKTQSLRTSLQKKKRPACTCDGVCKSCSIKQPFGAISSMTTPSVSEAKEMCLKMDRWDARHPKSMSPPGHPPALSHCVMQRKTCRPICKSRRREWGGRVQNTSAELLLERKPLAECFRRWPTKVHPNSPCPLFGKTRRITVKERNTFDKPDVVRICQAPVDDQVDTPYLRFAEMAKILGAWGAVKDRCAFCACGACPCSKRGYMPRDADRMLRRRSDMRQFDARVKTDCVDMKIMYDKP